MNKFKYINFILSILLISGCSLTRNLPDDQYIVYDVEVDGLKTSDSDAVKNLIQQKPNTRIPIFNFSPGVFLYQFGELTYDKEKLTAKKEEWDQERKELQSSIEQSPNRKLARRYNKVVSNLATLDKKITYGNWFMRTGNPRMIYDSIKTSESVRQIEFYLKNNGFFDATTEASVQKKRKKARITYTIEENSPYLIDSIYIQTADSAISELLSSKNQRSLITKGNRYAQNDLSRERQRVEDILKDNGYYTFSKSYVEFNVYKDSIAKTVTLEQSIRLPAKGTFHPIYTIDSILVTISSPTDAIQDENISREFKGIQYQMYRDRYAERIINSRIFLYKDDLYNRNDVIETQRQLANLDIFRIVNISFDTLGTALTTRIFTRPNQKFQITNQLGASVTEQLPGPFFSHSLRNRNLFRGLEIFEFNFRAGLEGVAAATAEGGVYRSRELSASGSVIFPQFLIPFNFGTLEKFGRYNPRTRTLLGYSYVNRPEYVRDALNTILAYNWATRNMRQQFSFSLLDANLIRSSLDTLFQARLEDLQNQGNNLINSFLPSFVSSVSGQVIINFNQYGLYQKNQASLWRIFVESGGTTLNFLNPSFTEDRSLKYFQFLKFQSDFRRYLPINNQSTFAYRINIGLAKPYGISGGVLPYEKYFFAGGSTSIRAWQPRRLGPGSFTPDLREDQTFDYRFEQPGEILLEAMFEYRRKLFGYFDGAIFVDAGNTWNFEVDPSRAGTEFRVDRFYKEIAVGTGLGLRMDFEFLVLRLDMGIKAYDPARPEGERFILDNLTLNRPLGEKGQQVFNIGIGYPF
ncbi:translocation and assembly module lipoprotein TamL [Lunatibacter salilacus]|uniref:translocation and assembly module lipoprotein TamL n=1 Tax=Lunatibacter salilacus TaxID=2483804 RepID=UPI00131D45B3|nr:BamA/TamA family outer membrane protein [Lunatibacter salilacus]